MLPFVATLAAAFMWISLFQRSQRQNVVCEYASRSLQASAAALVASVVLREHVVAGPLIALVIGGSSLNRLPARSWSMPGRIASAEAAGSARGD